MADREALVAAAREWLAASSTELEQRRYRVAFEAARHAAELAGKALLVEATGGHPKAHAIAGALSNENVLPDGVSGRRLHKLLSRYTAGTYGTEGTIRKRDVHEAIRLAERMVDGCD